MANKTKAENAAALKAAGISRRSFPIPVLCARNGISPGHYANMKKKGLGPKETDLDGVTVVTEEHETEWLQERAAASEAAE
jgi:hypothetical protein